jgi:hypothetical protein
MSIIDLESGPTSPWLFHALRAEGLPVVVIDARHAKPVLSLRINKTDRNDAVSLAELRVSGWYKPVTVKSLESHRIRTVLTEGTASRRETPAMPRQACRIYRQGGRRWRNGRRAEYHVLSAWTTGPWDPIMGRPISGLIEIEAAIETGAPENVVRSVTENSRALKFTTHGFEEE